MVRRLLVLPIRAYQLLVSPVLGSNCRYTQSCSSYAIEAIDRHGSLRGTGLAFCRIMRCNPWHAGGHDPVPASPVRERPLR